MAEEDPITADLPAATTSARWNPLRRFGCAIGLLLWAVIMISPCFIVVLATQGQITVTLGSAPDQQARIWLLSEARERGIGISWPSARYAQDQKTVCVQTTTQFILWAGSGQATTFCNCYTRDNDREAWTALDTTTNESCQP